MPRPTPAEIKYMIVFSMLGLKPSRAHLFQPAREIIRQLHVKVLYIEEPDGNRIELEAIAAGVKTRHAHHLAAAVESARRFEIKEVAN
jgi:hypothetical protein